MNIFFWFYKQLFYILKKITKHKFLLLFIFFIILLFLKNKVFAAVQVPEVVLEKAKELNHGYDNFVILQDTKTKEFYLPYQIEVYNSTDYQNKPWRYTFYKNVYCIATPSWWLTGLKVYKNNSFVDAPTNNVGSNSIIQMSMGTRELEIVYSSKNVIYFNVDGFTNGDIYYDISNNYHEFIFPYIADTDEVLKNLDNIDKILIFPR